MPVNVLANGPEGADSSGDSPSTWLFAQECEGDELSAFLIATGDIESQVLTNLPGDGLNPILNVRHSVGPLVGHDGCQEWRDNTGVIRVVWEQNQINELVRLVSILSRLTADRVNGVHVASNAERDAPLEANLVGDIEKATRKENGHCGRCCPDSLLGRVMLNILS